MDEQPVRKPAYWAVLPAEIRYDPELPDKAKLLYAEISSLTSETGYCWASNEHFCQLYDCTERTIRRLISTLAARGYIRIQDGNGGAGRRKIFAGINPLAGNPDKNVREPGQIFPGNPDKNVRHSKKESKKEDQNPPEAPQGAACASGGSSSGLTAGGRKTTGAAGEIWDPEAFERFWKLYPKKKDKAKAIEEWNKLKADRKLMRKMSAALGAQMASEEWRRDKGRAIPYPCRWLSHRRWEDELSVSLPAEKPAEEVRREWI